VTALPIDPKAPYSSPQHPANWRKPVFLVAEPAAQRPAAPTEAEPPAQAAEPVKTKPARKSAGRKKASDLAEALAKIGGGE
jgi:hypothetical protein